MTPVLVKHLDANAKIVVPSCLDDHRGKHVIVHVKEPCPPRAPTLATYLHEGVSAREGLKDGVYMLETDVDVAFLIEIAEDLPAGAVAWYALDPLALAKLR